MAHSRMKAYAALASAALVTTGLLHTWTRPWSFGMRLTRDPESQLFEYACHEGNEGMRNMLTVAREAEKKRQE